MTATFKNSRAPSREEDYGDYETRDVDAGWPYKDGPEPGVVPVGENPDYGNDPAPADDEPNTGYRISGTDDDGRQKPLRDTILPSTDGRESEDDLEERVTENIATLDDVATQAIDVHAEGHTVTLEGDVDDIDQARRVELAAMSVDGVHQVRNNLNLLGVDATMPEDD